MPAPKFALTCSQHQLKLVVFPHVLMAVTVQRKCGGMEIRASHNLSVVAILMVFDTSIMLSEKLHVKNGTIDLKLLLVSSSFSSSVSSLLHRFGLSNFVLYYSIC